MVVIVFSQRWSSRIGSIAVLGLFLVGTATAGPPPRRRAPHHNAINGANQLLTLSLRVQSRLAKLPEASTSSEKVVRKTANAFQKETHVLRRTLARWLVDPRPARASLKRLNKHAWTMHRHLNKVPRYRSIWGEWARVVTALRRVNRSMLRQR